MTLLGSHVSLGGTGQFLGSVREALGYGANALMIYTGAPQNTIRLPLSRLRIPEGRTLMRESGIPDSGLVVHAPYIVNLANPDPEKRRFAIDFLAEEVRRSAALGAPVLVLHPGAHLGEGLDPGIRRIADGVRAILAATEGLPVSLVLEGMAGKGTEVGASFDEIAALLREIGESPRVGTCLDTCHTHDSGYDLAGDPLGVLSEYDRVVGIRNLRVVHLNDSKNPRGSRKDRHENIGLGQIGFEALLRILRHPALESVPKILETPYVDDAADPKKSHPPYGEEIAMLKEGTFRPDLRERVLAREAGEGTDE